MSLPAMAEPARQPQEPVDEGMVKTVLEAAAQIREILRPLSDYEQHAALEVAKVLESHVRTVDLLSRSSAERPDAEDAVPQ